MNKLIILYLMIQVLFWSLGGQAIQRVRLEAETLEEAVAEYLSKTEEAEVVRQFLNENYEVIGKDATNLHYKKPPIYIYGGAALQIVSSVDAYLTRKREAKKLGKRTRGLPKSLSRALLSPFSDVDIAIDLPSNTRTNLANRLNQVYKEKVDNKVRWEVISLFEETGRGIFGNSNMTQQNTDALSSGMVRLLYTNGYPEGEFKPIMDVRGEPHAGGKTFFEAYKEGKNYYQDHPRHEETFLAKAGKNPKVVSALKYVSNMARYGYEGDPEVKQKVTELIEEFYQTMKDKETAQLEYEEKFYVLQRLDKILVKSLIDSVDIQRAIGLLREYKLDKISQLIKKHYPSYKSESTYWMKVLERSNVRTLSLRERNPGRPFQHLDKLEHLTIVDGSLTAGNTHPMIYIDENSSLARYLREQAQRIKAAYPGDMQAQLVDGLEILKAVKNNLPEELDVTKLLAYQDIKSCGRDCRDTALRSKYFLQLLGYKSYVGYGDSHTELHVQVPETDRYILFSAFKGQVGKVTEGVAFNSLAFSYRPMHWTPNYIDGHKVLENPPHIGNLYEELILLMTLAKSLEPHQFAEQLTLVEKLIVKELGVENGRTTTTEAIKRLLAKVSVDGDKVDGIADSKRVFSKILSNLENKLPPGTSRERTEYFKYVLSEYGDIAGSEFARRSLVSSGTLEEWTEKFYYLRKNGWEKLAEETFNKEVDIEFFKEIYSEKIFTLYLEIIRGYFEENSSEKLKDSLLERILELPNSDSLKEVGLRTLYILDSEYKQDMSRKEVWNKYLASISGYLLSTSKFPEFVARFVNQKGSIHAPDSMVSTMIKSIWNGPGLTSTEILDVYELFTRLGVINKYLDNKVDAELLTPIVRLTLEVPDLDVWEKLVEKFRYGTPSFREMLNSELAIAPMETKVFFEKRLATTLSSQKIVSCRMLFRN